MLDDLARAPRKASARHVVGTILAVTNGVATVRVTDRRVHRVAVPLWVDQSAGTPSHVHGPNGPLVGDQALLLITGDDDVWLLSWRRGA